MLALNPEAWLLWIYMLWVCKVGNDEFSREKQSHDSHLHQVWRGEDKWNICVDWYPVWSSMNQRVGGSIPAHSSNKCKCPSDPDPESLMLSQQVMYVCEADGGQPLPPVNVTQSIKSFWVMNPGEALDKNQSSIKLRLMLNGLVLISPTFQGETPALPPSASHQRSKTTPAKNNEWLRLWLRLHCAVGLKPNHLESKHNITVREWAKLLSHS